MPRPPAVLVPVRSRTAVAVPALLLGVLWLLSAAPASAAECGLFDPCPSSQVCDVIGECRHVPSREGEPCGIGVSCAAGLRCSASVGGRCQDITQPTCKTAGQGCGVFGGGGSCCLPLVCDVTGECRSDPPGLGQPCGAGVPCADPYACSATVGGRCEAGCRTSTEPCGLFAGAVPCCPGLECDVLAECRHPDPEEGEVCALDGIPGPQCDDGLTCEAGVPNRCVPKRGFGEPCFANTNCIDGYECAPFEQVCYPNAGSEIFDEAECLSYYEPALAAEAAATGDTLSYGVAAQGSAILSTLVERGTVYGPDGRYGCYLARCNGVETNLSVSTAICTGVFDDYDDFAGSSILDAGAAGTVTGGSAGIVSSLDRSEVYGGTVCLNAEAGVAPLAVGTYLCDTIVGTYLGEEGDDLMPVAKCLDEVELCGDVETCTAEAEAADFDDGSFDPDDPGWTGPLAISPSGPFGIGRKTVTLTATDADGLSDSCESAVRVVECEPPTIACPEPGAFASLAAVLAALGIRRGTRRAGPRSRGC